MACSAVPPCLLLARKLWPSCRRRAGPEATWNDPVGLVIPTPECRGKPAGKTKEAECATPPKALVTTRETSDGPTCFLAVTRVRICWLLVSYGLPPSIGVRPTCSVRRAPSLVDISHHGSPARAPRSCQRGWRIFRHFSLFALQGRAARFVTGEVNSGVHGLSTSSSSSSSSWFPHTVSSPQGAGA